MRMTFKIKTERPAMGHSELSAIDIELNIQVAIKFVSIIIHFSIGQDPRGIQV